MQLVKGGEYVGKGRDPSRIRDEDPKRNKIRQERRQDPQGIRSNVEFLQIVTHGKRWGESTEEIRRDIQGQKSFANLRELVRKERGNRVWRRRG